MAKNSNSKKTKEKELNVKEKNVKKSTKSAIKSTKKIKTNVENKTTSIKKVAKSTTKKAKTKNTKKESLEKNSTKISPTEIVSKFVENLKNLNEEIIDITARPIKSSKKKKSTSKPKIIVDNKLINNDKQVEITNGNIVLKDKKPDSTLKKFDIVEYYDLPYRYNKTMVKILAQTPTTLFVYWEISDDDRNRMINDYGQDVFNHSKPILIVNNDTKYYSFEVEINDFAYCWYIKLPEANCKYSVELARKSFNYNYNNPIPVSYSNKITMPNNKILYEDALNSLCYIPDGIYNANNYNINKNLVYFKNIKTESIVTKEFNSQDM